LKVSRFTQQDQIDESKWEAAYNAILREADQILAAEGPNHVRGLYFASVDDATTARMHVAGERVKAKGRQAIEVEAMKSRALAHVKEMFEASPYCSVCSEQIPTLEEASIFTPIGGKDRLIHSEGECFSKVIEQSIGRYAGRGRGRVIGSAAR
jgi:hypothetical protein